MHLNKQPLITVLAFIYADRIVLILAILETPLKKTNSRIIEYPPSLN